MALLQRINESLILNEPNGGAKAIINWNTAPWIPELLKWRGKLKMWRKKKASKSAGRRRERRPPVREPERKSHDSCSHWPLNLKYEAMWQIVCLSVCTGFNLTMRAANSPFTAGLEPTREWIRRDPDHFKCQGSHCRADEVSVKGGWSLVRDNDISPAEVT